MIMSVAGRVCVSLAAFVHLPEVTVAGCEVLPRLMKDQQPAQGRAISIAKKKKQKKGKGRKEKEEKWEKKSP